MTEPKDELFAHVDSVLSAQRAREAEEDEERRIAAEEKRLIDEQWAKDKVHADGLVSAFIEIVREHNIPTVPLHIREPQSGLGQGWVIQEYSPGQRGNGYDNDGYEGQNGVILLDDGYTYFFDINSNGRAQTVYSDPVDSRHLYLRGAGMGLLGDFIIKHGIVPPQKTTPEVTE